MITLTSDEITLIEKFIKREIDILSGDDAKLMNKIKDDAIELLSELNADDELDGSLIKWYYKKYKEQEEISE